MNYLNKRKNIVVTNNFVKHINCDKTEVVLNNGSVLQFDQIISTVNSKVLNQIYPAKSFDIPHNTWHSVNLAYKDRPSMKGTGYSVPSIENQSLISSIYNYNIFTNLAPSITLFGKAKAEVLIEEFQKHTGFVKDPDFVFSSVLQDAIPQHHVGHHLYQFEINYNKPEWLHFLGPSFYQSGIVSGMARAKSLVQYMAEKWYRENRPENFEDSEYSGDE